MDFGQLRRKSHDDAWKAASANQLMEMEEILMAMEGGAEALPYIKERLLA